MLEILLIIWAVVGLVSFVYCQFKLYKSIEEQFELTALELQANKHRIDCLQSMVFAMKEELERLKK